MKTIAKKLINSDRWAYGLFWSWNVIFLAFVLLGFAPTALPEMVKAVRAGTIPPVFLVYGVILSAIPAAAMTLAFAFMRRSPGKLLTLGYGVEGPLMLMLVLRFFVIRVAMPPVVLLFTVAGLGLATLLWQLLDVGIDQRGTALTLLRTIGLALLLLVGLYVAVWGAFYVAPATVELAKAIASFFGHLRFHWRDMLTIRQWRWVPFAVLGAILGVYSATLLVAMPIAAPILYVRAWLRGMRTLTQKHNRLRAFALTGAVVIVCAGLFVWTNQQPQHKAFALLETPPETPEEAQALLEQEDVIRAGLLNAYLAPYRYVSAVGEVYHVRDMYEHSLGLPPKTARRLQSLYEAVARPLLYEPINAPEPDERVDNRAFRQEPQQAAELYEAFFDQTIVEGEHDAVVRAARSTWMPEQARAAWLAVDDREVLLTHQEITITENGDWAEVELHEIYRNQTFQRQEVVYYFSLPESAVITGLWLGSSREERFAYRVAPRGAAQEVYRHEVRYRRDPALVEQIGPRQYRLRVFPVEPPSWRWAAAVNRTVIEEAPPLHMWLTYRVLTEDDAWPLPRLAEKVNVYWDDASDRLVNGEPMAVGEGEWLPESVPASALVERAAHRVDFSNGETIVARPVLQGDLPELPDDLRLAVVLDRSRSMTERRAEVKAALARLREAADPEAVDVYLTASKYHGEEPSLVSLSWLNLNNIVYTGGQNAAQLLAQFKSLHEEQDYDAIFVLTDDSGYELGDGDVEAPIPDAPVWMVHLGGDLPLGYDDATLEAIQASGGGSVGSVADALARLAVALEGEAYDVVDGYAWSSVPTEDAAGAVDDEFAPLAARRLILAEMHRNRGEIDQLATLDHLHEIATEHGIVTPYSSMIVLVNERQDKFLGELEEGTDRFQREHEEVGETKNPLTVTGVPEPEEWLLLALAAAMLIWYVHTMRRERIA